MQVCKQVLKYNSSLKRIINCKMSAIFHTRFLLQTQIIKVIDKRKKETKHHTEFRLAIVFTQTTFQDFTNQFKSWVYGNTQFSWHTCHFTNLLFLKHSSIEVPSDWLQFFLEIIIHVRYVSYCYNHESDVCPGPNCLPKPGKEYPHIIVLVSA